jgi:hypothetical protein
VLVDPLVEDRLWSWLDGEVALAEGRVVVLLTAPWHLRSTPMVSARYAAPVWAIEAARACLDDLPWLERLPTGIRAFVPRGTTVAGHDRCPGVRSVDARA